MRAEVRLLDIPRPLLLRAFAPSSAPRASLVAVGEDRVRDSLMRRAEALRFFDMGDLEQMSREEFAPGQLLFREGDPADKLYLLVSGAVCGACKPAVAALLGESGCRAATVEAHQSLSPDI